MLLYINKKSELLFKVFKGLIPSVDNNSHHKDTKKNENTKKQGLGATALHPDTVLFNKAILKAKREGVSYHKKIRLGKTKGELLKIIGEFEIIISGKVIKKAMTKDDSHIMSWENFMNLPDYINNPLAVFRSKTGGGVVVLTEIVNRKEKPIMVVVRLSKNVNIQEIKSLYSRKNDNSYQNWIKEGLLLYQNKNASLDRIFKQYNSASSKETHHKDTKKNENTKNLGLPDVEIEVIEPDTSIAEKVSTPEKEPKIYKPTGLERKGSLAKKLASFNSEEFEYFGVEDKAMALLLGNVERKTKESVVVTVCGSQGSMKTRFAFQFMNAMAKNYSVGHASIEEHPDSKLYYDKAIEYISPQAMNNVEAPEVQSLDDLHKLIERNDIIVIDSYAKLKEIDSKFEIDKDLRKKYDGKLFLVVFQQTTDGKMRGGSKSQFDGDIILFVEKQSNYKDNYIFCDKNRYNDTPLDELHYNIYRQEIVQPEKTEESIKEEEPIYEFSF